VMYPICGIISLDSDIANGAGHRRSLGQAIHSWRN
jgi:hypothetical protein